jgi:hypothetical protein
VNRVNRRNGLQFQHHGRVDDSIDPILAIQLAAAIDDRQRNLPPERYPPRSQLMAEALLVRRLEQAGPKRPMNADGGANDASGEVFLCALCASVVHASDSPSDRSGTQLFYTR